MLEAVWNSDEPTCAAKGYSLAQKGPAYPRCPAAIHMSSTVLVLEAYYGRCSRVLSLQLPRCSPGPCSVSPFAVSFPALAREVVAPPAATDHVTTRDLGRLGQLLQIVQNQYHLRAMLWHAILNAFDTTPNEDHCTHQMSAKIDIQGAG